MKYYNFKEAFNFIERHKKNIKRADLGMEEDWFFTAKTVFEDGEYKVDLNKPQLIMGIVGSYWATPTLRAFTEEGIELHYPCFIVEGTDIGPVERIGGGRHEQ